MCFGASKHVKRFWIHREQNFNDTWFSRKFKRNWPPTIPHAHYYNWVLAKSSAQICVIHWNYGNALFNRTNYVSRNALYRRDFQSLDSILVQDKCFADEILLNIQIGSYPCNLYLVPYSYYPNTHFAKVRSIHGILTNE